MPDNPSAKNSCSDMKPTLKLFHDLLPISQLPGDRKAAEVRELLDTVSGLSAHEVVSELTEHVVPAITEQKNFHMRFKLLEETLQEAGNALPVLERHIDLSSLPLPLAATTSALTADNLFKALVASYFKLAKTIFRGTEQESLIRIFHRAIDLVARRGARGFQSSEWAFVDQSTGGFLVRFIQGENWKPSLGNIVALQARESSSVHTCLVRRIATTSQGSLELGLQALSPQVSAVKLPCHDEIRRGINRHRLPGYGNRRGIIARPGHLASGHKVKLDALGDRRLWQIGRRLKASAGREFFALVPL